MTTTPKQRANDRLAGLHEHTTNAHVGLAALAVVVIGLLGIIVWALWPILLEVKL